MILKPNVVTDSSKVHKHIVLKNIVLILLSQSGYVSIICTDFMPYHLPQRNTLMTLQYVSFHITVILLKAFDCLIKWRVTLTNC